MIIYLHGFRSGPASFKARLLAAKMQELGLKEQWLCPQLPASPRAALDLVREQIQALPAPQRAQLCLIGSSLGGFYANRLAEEFACPAVLLNPAVYPARDLRQHLGQTTAWHSDQPFEFKPEYIAELEEAAVAQITAPERYFLLAATGDEVLDWREMLAHYAGARHRVINGSDHGISDFAAYIDEVLQFSGIKP